MRKLLLLLSLLAVAPPVYAAAKISLWQSGQNTRTHEPQTHFILTKTKLGGFNLHNFTFTQPVWSFGVTLRGSGDSFDPSHVTLTNHDLHHPERAPLKVESGSVQVDRTRNKITIFLRLSRDGQIEDFAGNGTYRVPAAGK